MPREAGRAVKPNNIYWRVTIARDLSSNQINDQTKTYQYNRGKHLHLSLNVKHQLARITMKNGIFKERMLLTSKFSTSNFHQIHIIEASYLLEYSPLGRVHRSHLISAAFQRHKSHHQYMFSILNKVIHNNIQTKLNM